MRKLATLASAALALITLFGGEASAAREGTSAGKPPAIAKTAMPVDINSATTDDLVSIKGVGPALAQKIVDLRTRLGGFSSIEDLLQVRGIGPKSLEKLRSNFTLAAPPSPVAQSPPTTPLP